MNNNNKSVRPSTNNRSVVHALRIVGMATYGFLLFLMLLGGLIFVSAMRDSKTAIQEAAVSATCACVAVGLYTSARCVEKLLAGVEKLLLSQQR